MNISVESGNVLGRVQIVDAPPAAPGHCAICGTTTGPMVDIGLNLEFYGVVYFCVENCLVELALSFDYHSPRQWAKAVDQINAQRDEINQLRDQNEQLRSAIDSITPLTSPYSIDRVPELDVDALYKEPDPEPEQLAFDFTEEGDRSSEQVDERRPADLCDDVSIDDFLADI